MHQTSKTYLALISLGFLDSAGYAILLSSLPFVAMSLGAGPLAVTALMSVQFVANAVGSLVLGRIADHVAQKKLLLYTTLASGLAYVGLGLSSFLPMLFFFRAMIGFSGANLLVYESYVSDMTLPHQRSTGIARLRIGATVGLIAGPGLSWISRQFDSTSASHLMVVAAAVTLIQPLIVYWTLPEISKQRNLHERLGFLAITRTFLADRRVRNLSITKTIVAMQFALLISVGPIWAQERLTWGQAEVSLMILAFGVALLTVQVPVACSRLKYLTSDFSMFVACGISVPFLCSLFLYPNEWTLVLAFAAIGVNSAVVNIAAPASISRISIANLGSILGLMASMVLIGRTVAPLLSGFVYGRFGSDGAWLLGCAWAVFATLITAKLHFEPDLERVLD